MNSIVSLNSTGQAVTTSLAIAEGVERPHASIIKLIRENLGDFEAFGLVGFEIQPRLAGQHGGSDTEFAILNEHQATLLITFLRNIGIVKEFKKRLVKAFFEMRDELNQRKSLSVDNLSRMDILQLAMQSEQERLRLEEQKSQLEDQIKEIQPKADALDLLTLSDGSECITVTAKLLQVQKPKLLFGFMSKERWIYRRSGSTTYVGYQDKIQQGLLEHKITEITRSDGTSKITQQVRVTPKGLAKLAEMLAKDGLIKQE